MQRNILVIKYKYFLLPTKNSRSQIQLQSTSRTFETRIHQLFFLVALILKGKVADQAFSGLTQCKT